MRAFRNERKVGRKEREEIRERKKNVEEREVKEESRVVCVHPNHTSSFKPATIPCKYLKLVHELSE